MSAVSGGERSSLAPGVRLPLAVPRRLLRMRSDAVLAERVAAGDEAAFDVLYERHRPVVLAVCMAVLGTAHDAEDATQETFTALSIALRNNTPAELRPWLIRVARNASIDTTRRRKHRLLTRDGELPDIPVRPATGKAEFAVVMDGIRELPEQQRTALLMRELGGHSYTEIADFMELDEDAVRGLIARARVGLRSYREATELPCATARACIETEPDGRRYDKTIRRHLRGCSSCRAYRTALRGDAKALRAALPFQTGAFSSAGSGLATSALGASKAALVGAGMTQMAATCAASVCAVGTVGGMVLIAPIHHLFGNSASKPVAAVLAKPHHGHRSLITTAVTKPLIVTTVSKRAVPARHVASSVHRSTDTVRFARSDRHPGSTGAAWTHDRGTGIRHHAPTASNGSRLHGDRAAPATQPVQAPPAGSPSSSAPTSVQGTTGSTSGSTGTGTGVAAGSGSTATGTGSGSTTSGTTAGSPTSGAGVATSGATTSGASTGDTSTTQSPLSPVTTTVNNVLHSVVSGLTGQSGSSGTGQTTTQSSTPLGL